MREQFPRVFPLGIFAAAIVVVACSTVPDTGRKQFNALPPMEEARLGLTEFEKMKREKPVSRDPALNAQVERVGRQLSKVMPVPHAEWEFVVFEDDTPNAFALPGGKVGVHTGLFPITQSDAGLAAVMGHEVAHVVARHSGERMTQGALTAGAAVLANEVLRQNTAMNDSQQAITATALGGAALLRTQRFSRRQELEADQLGALYMARAGYNPRESVDLWRRFARWRVDSGNTNKVPAFLNTHPLDSVRIEELERFLPRAMAEYRQGS